MPTLKISSRIKIGRVLVLSSRIHDSIVLNIFLASFSITGKKPQPKHPSQSLLSTL